MRFGSDQLRLEIEDHGSGLAPAHPHPGIGMVAMRERAELLGGSIRFDRPPEGGTRVAIDIPRETLGSYA